jgi:hypothetical protein
MSSIDASGTRRPRRSDEAVNNLRERRLLRMRPDRESEQWVGQLRPGHPRRNQTVAILHGALLRVAFHPIDVLAIQFGTNRNAIYKNLFDARRNLRARMAAARHPVREKDAA